MAFKAKNKSRGDINTKQTIDATHQDMIDYFNNQKELLPDLREEVFELKIKLDELNDEAKSCPIVDFELQQKIWNLEDKINELKKIITNIENNTEENDYILKTSKLLNKYYYLQDKEKEESYKDNIGNNIQNTNSNIPKKKTVMDWFFENKDVEKQNSPDIILTNDFYISTDDEDKDKDIQNILKKNKMKIRKNNKKENKNDDSDDDDEKKRNEIQNDNDIKELKEKNKYTKDKIYNQFMKIVDKNYVTPINEDEIITVDICKKCYVEMLLNQNTGLLICPKCGIVEKIIINSDKPSYKDPPKEQTSFCYKRINHLNEFLAQFQAKETTEIPEEVYNEILIEIKKQRIENMAEITVDKMKSILRKIKRTDYYDHVPYIINQLGGLPPPVISPIIEEIIRGMFKTIQIPFLKHCPESKKNFLSYGFVMYKFFELLELDEYLECFKLLKSISKLREQDQIWKKICKDLDWEYIPSV